MARDDAFLLEFEQWTRDFTDFVARKGRVEPGKHRAYGYKAPGHRLADVKLWLREMSMRVGKPPADSSPSEQQDLGLSRDVTLFPKKGEGEKLRDE